MSIYIHVEQIEIGYLLIDSIFRLLDLDFKDKIPNHNQDDNGKQNTAGFPSDFK